VAPEVLLPQHFAAARMAPPADQTAGTLPAPAAEMPQRLVDGAPPLVDWWTVFGNPALDALVDEALERHPSVDAARAVLRQAQAELEANRAQYLMPQLGAQAQAFRQRANSASAGGNFPSAGEFNLLNAGVSVSYHPDLFGGIREALDGLGAQIDVQRFQLEATRLSLAGNIVTAAAREAGIRAQRDATLGLMQHQQAQLSLARARLALGSATRAETLGAELAVRATAATLPALDKSLAQLRNQLAVYVGRPAGAAPLPEFRLEDFRLPRELPLSLPSELARQRPDLRAAEAALRAANAAVGVADSNLYPSLTLSGSLGTSANRFDSLLSPAATLWSLGASLSATLFDGGALRARKRGAEAAYAQVGAQYRSVVLLALQNVDDALAALQHDARSVDAQLATAGAARQAAELSQNQLTLGSATRQQVLAAELTALQAELALGPQRAARIADTAALFQSLGGGWSQSDAGSSLSPPPDSPPSGTATPSPAATPSATQAAPGRAADSSAVERWQSDPPVAAPSFNASPPGSQP
jgi:NodT family efflux transporter outer membrane factor (OMF) lipoprotein